MAQERSEATKRNLIGAATELVRRKGYNATSVDDICQQAGITKGAFFHHYSSKEALVEAALSAWHDGVAEQLKDAPFQRLKDPRKRVLGFMDFFIAAFSQPEMLKSCLAGTTVQEAAETHPRLRDAANHCFSGLEQSFGTLLAEATSSSRKKPDIAGLASLWVAVMQGSLILYKASRDEQVIARNLTQIRDHIAAQLPK